jgi:hypothetical protein
MTTSTRLNREWRAKIENLTKINARDLDLYVSDETRIEEAIAGIPERHLIQYMAMYYGDEIKDEIERIK